MSCSSTLPVLHSGARLDRIDSEQGPLGGDLRREAALVTGRPSTRHAALKVSVQPESVEAELQQVADAAHMPTPRNHEP